MSNPEVTISLTAPTTNERDTNRQIPFSLAVRIGPSDRRWCRNGRWRPDARIAVMRRGDIRLVDLEPVRRADANTQRPASIVSNDGANSTAQRLGRGVVTVVPVTSNTEHVYAFQVLLLAQHTGLAANSKAQAEQVRSIAVERIGPQVGTLTAEPQAALDEALRLQLGL